MSYHQACDLLDRVRHGYKAPPWLINKALQMTGDLDDEGDWLDNYRFPEDPHASVPSAGSNKDADQGQK